MSPLVSHIYELGLVEAFLSGEMVDYDLSDDAIAEAMAEVPQIG